MKENSRNLFNDTVTTR